MLNRISSRRLLMLGIAAASVFSGIACTTMTGTTTTGDTTLLSSMIASNAGVFVSANKCTTPAGGDHGFQTTFNAVANKLVTITVTGPVTNSRPQIQVRDILGTQVANTGATPTTQTNTTTFTPTGNQLFILGVSECAGGIAVGSIYTVSVTQAP